MFRVGPGPYSLELVGVHAPARYRRPSTHVRAFDLEAIGVVVSGALGQGIADDSRLRVMVCRSRAAAAACDRAGRMSAIGLYRIVDNRSES